MRFAGEELEQDNPRAISDDTINKIKYEICTSNFSPTEIIIANVIQVERFFSNELLPRGVSVNLGNGAPCYRILSGQHRFVFIALFFGTYYPLVVVLFQGYRCQEVNRGIKTSSYSEYFGSRNEIQNYR